MDLIEDNRGTRYSITKPQRKLIEKYINEQDELIHDHTIQVLQHMLDTGYFYEVDSDLLNTLYEYFNHIK